MTATAGPSCGTWCAKAWTPDGSRSTRRSARRSHSASCGRPTAFRCWRTASRPALTRRSWRRTCRLRDVLLQAPIGYVSGSAFAQEPSRSTAFAALEARHRADVARDHPGPRLATRLLDPPRAVPAPDAPGRDHGGYRHRQRQRVRGGGPHARPGDRRPVPGEYSSSTDQRGHRSSRMASRWMSRACQCPWSTGSAQVMHSRRRSARGCSAPCPANAYFRSATPRAPSWPLGCHAAAPCPTGRRSSRWPTIRPPGRHGRCHDGTDPP